MTAPPHTPRQPFPGETVGLGRTRMARQTAIRSQLTSVLAFALANHADYTDLIAYEHSGFLDATVDGHRIAIAVTVAELT